MDLGCLFLRSESAFGGGGLKIFFWCDIRVDGLASLA